MTNEEFSIEFDILYNNITSNQAPGLNNYEKSVFLTKAQEELVTAYYNGTAGKSFELTEEMRRLLDNLVLTKEYQGSDAQSGIGVSDNSKFFLLPPSLAFITMEQIIYSEDNCFKGKRVNVIPVKQDEYNKIKDNPFRGITDYKALRLDAGEGIVEIISKYTIGKYLIRYINKPSPIILEDLSGLGVSINGETQDTPCALNSLLHRTILDRAVLLAKATWQSTTESKR